MTILLKLQAAVGGNPPAQLVLHTPSATISVCAASLLLIAVAVSLFVTFKPPDIERIKVLTGLTPEEALRLPASCNDTSPYGEKGLFFARTLSAGSFYIKKPMRVSDVVTGLDSMTCRPILREGSFPSYMVTSDITLAGDDLYVECDLRQPLDRHPALVMVSNAHSLEGFCKALTQASRSIFEAMRIRSGDKDPPVHSGVWCGLWRDHDHGDSLNFHIYFEWPLKPEVPVLRVGFSYSCDNHDMFQRLPVIDCFQSNIKGVGVGLKQCAGGVIEAPLPSTCKDSSKPNPEGEEDCASLMSLPGVDFASRGCPEDEFAKALRPHVKDDEQAWLTATSFIKECPVTCGKCGAGQGVCQDSNQPNQYIDGDNCTSLMAMAGSDFARKGCPQDELANAILVAWGDNVDDPLMAAYLATEFILACPETCGKCAANKDVCEDSNKPNQYNDGDDCISLMSMPGLDFARKGCPQDELANAILLAWADHVDDATAAHLATEFITACPLTCGICIAGDDPSDANDQDQTLQNLNVTLVEEFAKSSLLNMEDAGTICPDYSSTFEEVLIDNVSFYEHELQFLKSVYSAIPLFQFQCLDMETPSFISQVSYVWPMLSIMQNIAMVYLVKIFYSVLKPRECSADGSMSIDVHVAEDRQSKTFANDELRALVHALREDEFAREAMKELLRPSMADGDATTPSAECRRWKEHVFDTIDLPLPRLNT